MEAQQMRHDREHVGWGTDPDPGLGPIRSWLRSRLAPGWRRAQIISHRSWRG
jgi:hypothetical protein